MRLDVDMGDVYITNSQSGRFCLFTRSCAISCPSSEYLHGMSKPYKFGPLLKAIQRHNDTAIHGAGAGAGAKHKLCKLINYLINYCFQSPQETLVIVFSGGGRIYLKISIIK